MSENSPGLFTRPERLGLTLLLVISLIIGVSGIVRYGYIGQDFDTHSTLMLTARGHFDYSLPDPPGLSVVGYFLYQHAPFGYRFELIGLCFLLLNTAALLVIYRFIWRMITAPALRWAAAALVTLLPVRMIHGVVFATDAFTLPFFAVIAVFVIRLREDPRRGWSWVGLALVFSLSLVFKYSFVGLFAPILLIAISSIIQVVPRGARLKPGLFTVAALAVPLAVFALEMHASHARGGQMTDAQWLPSDAPSKMRWRDLLFVEANDFEIFFAPAYFDDELYADRSFSYPALLFISTVNDPLNYFQWPYPTSLLPEWRNQTEFGRPRSVGSKHLQAAATVVSLPAFLLAIGGTMACAALGVQALCTRRSHLSTTTVVLVALAIGYYSPVFLGLHRIARPYQEGFWLARLVIPAIVVFFLLGFVLVDLVTQRLPPDSRLRHATVAAATGWSLANAALFAAFLV